MIQFGPWEIPDEEFLTEVSSYEKAKAITPDHILSFEPDEKTAEITGRTFSSYYVTMDSCTCADFDRRQLPCKHMIRLALEHEMELKKVNERLARLDFESQYPYREIMTAVLESGPVTMAKLKKQLSGIPESEVHKGVNKLVSMGSVTRTKSSNSAKAACLYSVSEQ